MLRDEIISKVYNLIKTIAQNEDLSLEEETIFEEIDGWDSLNTVDLEMEVESKFNVSFETGEFVEYNSIKELIDCLEGKLNS